VDITRNRLIYDDDAAAGGTNQAYAISLNNIQLTPHAATPVTVTSLGSWVGSGNNSGWRKADNQFYYFVDGTTQLHTLTFGPTGLITGDPLVGNFTGPTAMTGGDIDFDSNGSIWVSGTNSSGEPRLWNFDFGTLDAISTLSPNSLYNGMTFNAEGTTLYGYTDTNGEYGSINLSTGAFQSVLQTDPAFFGGGGDLATGTEEIVLPAVPEPNQLGIFGLIFVGCLFRFRRGRGVVAG